MRYLIAATLLSALAVTPASATQVAANDIATSGPIAQPGQAAVSIDVDLRAGSQPLWSGTLRIGTPHGSANFSQSKNEYADPCPGEAGNNSRSASYNLNFYINHRYSQDSANEFDVNVQLLRPQSACPGRGTDTAGFQRSVVLEPGRTAMLSGPEGLSIKLTRRAD